MELEGYASTDAGSRLAKARKIEALLGGGLQGLRLLDLGAGSGVLAEYFAGRGAAVTAADSDIGKFAPELPVHRIDGPELPFKSGSFDLVVLNHVLEHVGPPPVQATLLREIGRVLAPGGRIYLAVPSKWALIEPHLRLPLLGAMPRAMADWMVRRFRGKPAYDCFPPAYRQLRSMMRQNFANIQDRTAQAAGWAIEHELTGMTRSLMRLVPRPALAMMHPLYPTFILVGTRAGPG